MMTVNFINLLTFMVSKMKSKEDALLERFFNEPSRHWRFKELRSVGLPDNKISRWLKRFVAEQLVQKIIPEGKLPYYVSRFEHPNYQTRKRLFMQQQLYASGFLNHLSSLKEARTVILFGSVARGDWHKGSDIDLFILGRDDDLEQAAFEQKLGREIQVFNCKNEKSLATFNNELLLSIVKGDIIKGDVDFLEVHRAESQDARASV
jgi:predicted nucleotidyltransferase